MAKKEQKEITVIRKYAPEYRTQYASTVVVRRIFPAAERNFIIEFAIDKPAEPNHSVHKVSAEGSFNLGKADDSVAMGDLVREFQSSVVMSLDGLKKLHSILGQVIKSESSKQSD